MIRHFRADCFAMDYCSEFQEPRQDTVSGFCFWNRISMCGTFLVHCDRHVPTKADWQEVILRRRDFGDSDCVAGGNLHLVVHA